MKEAVAKAKAMPIGEPFDDDEHHSDELSASESNRPIDPKQAVVPEAPGKHQVANSSPTKTSQKKTRVKAGTATPEEGESAPKAPAKQGGKGKGANKANCTDQTDPSGEAGIDAVPIAGAGGKGRKGGKNEKAPLNKDGAEGNPAGGRATRGKAAKASVAEPVSKEQMKRATHSNKVTNTGAATK
ncbi:hypothetical protein FRC11_001052 [Ceratobasidium sp. 423]|nr:hypothetical protein FRC11_001052 [Ceratobasidium sp. 423]